MVYLIIFFTGLYVLIVLALLFFAEKQLHLKLTMCDLSFTLIIPAKDEEKNITACLSAIYKQNYNLNHLDIILMDDNSSDKTIEIASKFLNQFPSFRIESVTQNSKLIGKANGIDQGIALARHEIILITDADCESNPNWIQTIANEFQEDISVVSGFTLLRNEKISLFGILQNIDWIFLLGVGSSAVGMKHPISCIGSNLAFRKSTYQNIGGYKKLKFSITEDLLLYKSFSRDRKNKFAFPLNQNAIIWSKPMKSFEDFYNQRKRWIIGSIDLSLFGASLLAGAVLAHLLSLVSFTLFFSSGNISDVFPPLIVFICDTILLSFYLFHLKQIKLVFYLPLYFIFYLGNTLIIPFILLFDRKIIWKGRKYSRQGVLH